MSGLEWVETWVSKSPPQKKTMRYPHLEHPLSHGRVDLKEIIQSSLPVAMASQNDFRDPPFWTIRQWPFFLGTPFSLDSHRCDAPNGKLASGPQQEPFTSVVPVSVAHMCVVYPTCTVESREFFQFKTLQTRLEMGSNRRSCDLFSKEIMQFCTGEGCPLPNTLIGTMLRFDL